MKLEIKRQDFLKAWQTAEKIAVSKAITDIVNSIRINAVNDENVTLEATDLKTSVKCKAKGAAVIEPGTAVVPVLLLGGMLKKLKCETLTIEVNDTRGMLFAEGSKSRFPVVPLEAFPKIPESTGAEAVCEINAKKLSDTITEGGSASSQPQDFPKYLGACLMSIADGALKIVSTDGKRLAVSKAMCENVFRQEDILLPSNPLKELAKQLSGDSNVKIISDGTIAWFALEDTEFSIRRIDASFPDYQRILNSNVAAKLQMSCEDLISVVERVDIVARTTIPHIMVMDMNPDGNMRIYARSPEGVARESLKADITGGAMQVGFNAAFFLEGLKALGSGDIVIEFSGTEEQTRMMRNDSDDFLYMLMPSRLSPMDIIDDELDDNDDNSETHDDMPESMPEGEENF
ncbi:MAG: DNA polymerase III subunit beta [Synergistaceae bacterium]|nr:DNA polymerase III subunit beta [Synergistaceae bacterium]